MKPCILRKRGAVRQALQCTADRSISLSSPEAAVSALDVERANGSTERSSATKHRSVKEVLSRGRRRVSLSSRRSISAGVIC